MAKEAVTPAKTSGKSDRARRNGPPRLQLHIFERLKVLLLINIIPIFIGVILAWNYSQGKLELRLFEESHGLAAFVVLASCLIIGISWWVIIPCAKWLRNYPRGVYRHESKAVWVLPYVCGSVIWGLLWVLCTLAGLIACGGMIAMFYSVFAGSDVGSVSETAASIFLF